MKRPERGLSSVSRLKVLSLFLPFLSGMLLAYGLYLSGTSDGSRRSLFFLLLVLLLAGLEFLVGGMIWEGARREEDASRAIAWLQAFQQTVHGIASPLNAERVRPIGDGLVALLGEHTGWILFLKVPGLLIRGEVLRRQYLEVVSLGGGPWETAPVERLLRDQMESDQSEWQERLALPGRPAREVRCWVHKLLPEEIGIGLAVVRPRAGGRGLRSALVMAAFQTGLRFVLLHLRLQLADLDRRRELLGEEGLGLKMRVLVHEVSGELQSAYGWLANARQPLAGSPEVDWQRAVSAHIARAAHWAYLFRDMPYGAEGIPASPQQAPLLAMLEDVLHDAHLAWPETLLKLKGGDPGWQVGVRMLSVFRNLIFNAASFCPEGRVLVRVARSGPHIQVEVLDSGPGLTRDQAENIFTSGVVPDNPQRARGMGVGLRIAREITLAYGGNLLCHARDAQHPGGCFEVLYPLVEEETDAK